MVNLESSPLFRALPDAEKAALIAGVELRRFKPGHEIFKEGDPGDGVYVVRSGTVAISAAVRAGERTVISEVGPGDFFGEMAVLDRQPRSASAFVPDAAPEVEVYFIAREHIMALLARSTELSMTLLREISQRMREFNQHYVREVLQAERMALIGRFAHAIVHDLKNPLTVIGITTEMACLEGASVEARKSAEQRIHRQIDRITGMVNDILEFTRGSGGPVMLSPVDYGAFVRSVIEELEPEVNRKSVTIQFLTPPPPVKLRLHPQRFTRVFYNLIFNAVDEMPRGGRVDLKFHNDGGGVVTEIADTGRGIAPEIIDRMFEPFATHGKTKGTGLGLSIVRRIIEEHGGQISARNRDGDGGGAVFSFSLPMP